MNVRLFYFEGPLTYTENGKTILYGVVSGAFIPHDKSTIPIKMPLPDETMFTRVAHPDILEWITDFMLDSEKD